MVVRRKGYCPGHAHGAHGLCRRCYWWDRNADLRSRRYWRACDLLAEYEHLISLPEFRTKAEVAARLGVKPATLGRAIVRGRAYRRRDAAIAEEVAA
jgi:hypothetical protein